MGAVAAAFGALLSRFWWPSVSGVLVIIAVSSIAAAVLEARRDPRRLPGIHRQVSEEWRRRYRSWVYALGYGFQLGFGLVTIVASASVYLTVTVAFVSASVAVGTFIGAAFGLSRAFPVLATRQVVTSARLHGLHQRLHELGRTARAATITLELALTAAATGLAVGFTR
jgi:hypothetical protein